MTLRQTRAIERGTVAVFLVALVGMLLPPAPSQIREGPVVPQCQNQLKQLGLALWNYHDQYQCFPPAYVADEYGRPIHSWRTLLLPYLDAEPLHRDYSFNEPWDGALNSQLHTRRIGSVDYHCRRDQSEGLQTSFVAVVGPNTAWPDQKCLNRSRDFPDGKDRTIMVVEVVNSGIHWMEPRDLRFGEMSFVINDKAAPSISSNHVRKVTLPWYEKHWCVHVLFADGSVHCLPAETAPQTLRALLTRNGGEED